MQFNKQSILYNVGRFRDEMHQLGVPDSVVKDLMYHFISTLKQKYDYDTAYDDAVKKLRVLLRQYEQQHPNIGKNYKIFKEYWKDQFIALESKRTALGKGVDKK